MKITPHFTTQILKKVEEKKQNNQMLELRKEEENV